MGDNRDDSLDSRFPAVRRRDRHGSGRKSRSAARLVTFWSTDGSASYCEALDLVHARFAASRIGNGYTAMRE